MAFPPGQDRDAKPASLKPARVERARVSLALGMSRRTFLRRGGVAVASGLATPMLSPQVDAQETKHPAFDSGFRIHTWQRDPRNPILPPGGGPFDVGCCMNPCVIRQGATYWMFYSGADKDGFRRICLAKAPVDRLDTWERLGPLFDVGAAGTFDETWCVLPLVHKINGRRHLYYTGRSAQSGVGLQAFHGIGLLVSDDLEHWTKYSEEPVLRGDGFAQWPENKGLASGGCLLDLPQPDGSVLVRMYYTLATGSVGSDLRVNQQKFSVCAHSKDGITWDARRVLMGPREEADYENAATIGLNVWPVNDGFRALYGEIGTRFGAYSICEARSLDGLRWDRGAPEDNLALAPEGSGWESRMTTYPMVLREDDHVRLFYCGNGYGATGIGVARATPL